MGRRLRFIPPEGALVEVTCRTVQGRFLLTPSTELNEIILGVLGRAQRLYPVGCCGYACLSNHYHILLEVADARQLSTFMGYFNSNLAREVARRTGWTDKVWARRYQAIPVSEEPGAQVARLAYLLSHGTKEGLVETPAQWPGVHCVRPLLAGESSVEGLWFDRTREYNARLRGESFERRKLTNIETVTLSPLPCWKHLTPEARLVGGVEELAAAAAAIAFLDSAGTLSARTDPLTMNSCRPPMKGPSKPSSRRRWTSSRREVGMSRVMRTCGEEGGRS